MDEGWFWIILCWMLIIGVWLWTRRIEREVREIEKDVTAMLSNVLFMQTEKHDDMIFAYDAMSGNFICQGATMEELNINFGKRYPNRRGVLVEEKGTQSVL